MSFASSMEAKEFLIARIVEEASRQQVPLSDLERFRLRASDSSISRPAIRSSPTVWPGTTGFSVLSRTKGC